MITAVEFGVIERLNGADIHELFDDGFDGTLVVAAPDAEPGESTAWVVAPGEDGLFMEGVAKESETLGGPAERQYFLVPNDGTKFIAWFPYGR